VVVARKADLNWKMSISNSSLTIAGLWTYGDWRHVATGCTVIDPVMSMATFIFYLNKKVKLCVPGVPDANAYRKIAKLKTLTHDISSAASKQDI